MKTYLIALLALTFISTSIFAQKKGTPKNNKATQAKKLIQEKAGRPDVPGELNLQVGYNIMQETPEGIDFKWSGSRTFNAYYQYDINIGESSFSFHPGIGVGTEKYAFTDRVTLARGNDADNNYGVIFVGIDSTFGRYDVRKSQINTNYLDIPFELRWRSRKYDPKRSIKVSIGAKVGILFDSKTKIKYRDDNQWKTLKQKEDFDLAKIRYGIYGKVGIGGISLFYYYSMSDVFTKDKGPENTTMYPMTIGLNWAIF